MKNQYSSADEAIFDVSDDNSIALGGFGLVGIPENLISALKRSGKSNLTIYSSNAGTDYAGLGLLLQNKQVKKLFGTYIGENNMLLEQYLNGDIEIECVPQGTLAEKLRAGGAGIPAFYCKAGLGTPI